MKALDYQIAFGIRTEELVIKAKVGTVSAVCYEDRVVFSGNAEDLICVGQNALVSRRSDHDSLDRRISCEVLLNVGG